MAAVTARKALPLLEQAAKRLRDGQTALALALAEQAAAVCPDLPEVWLTAGQLHLETGDPGAAAACLEKARRLRPDDGATLAAYGVALHAAGDAAGAEDAFRTALEHAPDDAACRADLALLYSETGRAGEAAALLADGIARTPQHPRLHRLLGDALAAAGCPHEAVAAYQRASGLDPADRVARNNLGGVLRSLRLFDEAVAAYEEALALAEDMLVWSNLSGACLEAGNVERAVAAAERAVALAPDEAVAVRRLGDAFAAAGDERAETLLRRAHALAPDDAETAYNLAVYLSKTFRSAEALEFAQKALAGQGAPAVREAAQRVKALALRTLGKQDASRAAFAALLATGQASLVSRACAALAAIPLVYRDEAELAASRETYAAALRDLDAAREADPEAFAAGLAGFAGALQPFYLAYQGLCDRDLQALYGKILHDAHTRAHPALAAPLPRRTKAADERLELGIVSGYFHQHSNWKIPIKGLLEHLDRERFHVSCYYTGTVEDARTLEARRLADRFRAGGDWRGLAQAIRADGPDILLYPEIGMHPDTLRLALLRLAPVQCVSWGHPDTSGLPTMDYYLSSDLMEPPDADGQYTERLVRLPGLSCVYTPLDFPVTGGERASFGLPADATIVLCPQSLPKYLPRRDALLARIAAEVPNCRFVFLESWVSAGIAAVLRERLHRAFAAQGLDADRHVVFLPHMSTARFHDLCRAADMALDTPDWSGCNSSLEAFANDLPVLTLPGSLMRGRHTLAFLMMMECEDLIAADEDDYVAKAVALALDPARRRHAARRIARNQKRLYDDPQPIRALERAFADMAARAGRP